MPDTATEYSPDFYETIRQGCRSSAEAVVPIVLEQLQPYEPATVVDVGCGEGWWGKAFQDAGCEVLGLDGDYVESPAIDLHFADLARPRARTETYDLAVALEVAEHLPPERAAGFVEDLCAFAPVVLFSAAIPGQGGVGHLNEQWPVYWVELFEAQGYSCSGALRWLIWTDDRVENWYRQNLMVAALHPGQVPAVFKSSEAAGPIEMVPVVHPVLYDARRA